MAVLLPLFFVFTGAVLNYIAGLFKDIAKPPTTAEKIAVISKTAVDPSVILGTDYRLLQIYFISAIALVFTGWSLAFVVVFRTGAGKMLQRASEIENLFPGLPQHHRLKSFGLLNRWYNRGKRFSALRMLFWSTFAFFVLIFGAYVAIIATAVRFNRL